MSHVEEILATGMTKWSAVKARIGHTTSDKSGDVLGVPSHQGPELPPR